MITCKLELLKFLYNILSNTNNNKKIIIKNKKINSKKFYKENNFTTYMEKESQLYKKTNSGIWIPAYFEKIKEGIYSPEELGKLNEHLTESEKEIDSYPIREKKGLGKILVGITPFQIHPFDLIANNEKINQVYQEMIEQAYKIIDKHIFNKFGLEFVLPESTICQYRKLSNLPDVKMKYVVNKEKYLIREEINLKEILNKENNGIKEYLQKDKKEISESIFSSTKPIMIEDLRIIPLEYKY